MSLLEVKNLKTSFKTLRGMVTAIDGVSFNIDKDEMVAIIGEVSEYYLESYCRWQKDFS